MSLVYCMVLRQRWIYPRRSWETQLPISLVAWKKQLEKTFARCQSRRAGTVLISISKSWLKSAVLHCPASPLCNLSNQSILSKEKGLELLQFVKWLRAAPANCRPSCTQTTVATSTCATQGPKPTEMQHNKRRTADVEIAVDFGCRFFTFFNVNVM